MTRFALLCLCCIVAFGQTITPPSGGGGGGSGTVTSIATGCGTSGGTITTSGTVIAAEIVNVQTAATYTVLNGDCGKLLSLSRATAIAVTLPQANGSTFVSGWFLDVQNVGVGTATITPTTSTIDGVASLALTTGQGVRIVSNGTNYFTQRGVGGLGTSTNTQVTYNNNGVVGGITGATTDGTTLTLVGAHLGTPADGVGTNFTGIPAAAILPGTLGAGNYTVNGNLTVGTSVARDGVIVFDQTSLGSETLTNPNLTSGTSWTAAGDFALTGNAAVWTESSGTGTITQAAGVFATPGVPNHWYKFTYVVSAITGSPTCSIPLTAFAARPAALTIVAGPQTTYFQSEYGSPAPDFAISCSGVATETVTFDTLSLKQISGADVKVGGNLMAGSISSTGPMTVGPNGNIIIGPGSGILGYPSITTADANIGIGQRTGFSAISSIGNVSIGEESLFSNVSGRTNMAIGLDALWSAGGDNNVGIGQGAGWCNATTIDSANQSTFIGAFSGCYNNNGNLTGDYNSGFGASSFGQLVGAATDNTAAGAKSCTEITTGAGVVCLGANSGPTANQSNKLFIDNTKTDTPLIGGDFSAHTLSITDSGGSSFSSLKTTGSATGKTVVCVDVATGRLYASTSGVACAN